ncbi:pre-mRNA-splicing factor CWC22 homolog [Ruditapes philippinarum]|uniref:pre-mRNA-splicing factor CWC22 homolog n=1 Tax=Ruditapes philippinarum TaxID=129788 RepID=UPI00295BC6A8|nr:pre-mRNA-splicing factor CWC22 homolog [Ruditapes philippinarum]
MDPEGEREGAAAKLTEWKKSKMPNLVQKVKSGFLTELRRLQTEYGPTPCEYNKTESVKSSEITSMDIDTDLKIMIKNPISPVQSPKRNVLIKNMDLEEISDEELDFVDTDAESKTQKQTKETNKHKMNNNIETSDTSSSSSSSSSSDSSSETSSSESSVVPKKKVTNSRKRRRSWKRFCTSLSDTSSDSDSDSDSALVETKKKKKENKDMNKRQTEVDKQISESKQEVNKTQVEVCNEHKDLNLDKTETVRKEELKDCVEVCQEINMSRNKVETDKRKVIEKMSVNDTTKVKSETKATNIKTKLKNKSVKGKELKVNVVEKVIGKDGEIGNEKGTGKSKDKDSVDVKSVEKVKDKNSDTVKEKCVEKKIKVNEMVREERSKRVSNKGDEGNEMKDGHVVNRRDERKKAKKTTNENSVKKFKSSEKEINTKTINLNQNNEQNKDKKDSNIKGNGNERFDITGKISKQNTVEDVGDINNKVMKDKKVNESETNENKQTKQASKEIDNNDNMVKEGKDGKSEETNLGNVNHIESGADQVKNNNSENKTFNENKECEEVVQGECQNEINNQEQTSVGYCNVNIIPLMEETQKERIILNIGGQKFETSRVTLTKDPNSLLAKIVSPEGMTPRYGNQYFIDRDPAHFRFILNFLRNGSCDLRTLPHDVRYLYELYYEASFYCLPELVNAVIGKIEQCSVVSANLVPLKAHKLG